MFVQSAAPLMMNASIFTSARQRLTVSAILHARRGVVGTWLTATALAGLAAATAPEALSAPPAPAVAARPALTVALTPVVQAVLPVTLAANGAIHAWQEAILGAELGGLRLVELHAAVGDSVRRGQLLATFASEAVQTDLRLAQAALAEARAQASEASANAERARHLQDTGTLSEQQVQQMLTQEQMTQAQVQTAEARVAAQQLRLSQTRVLAPDDGVITARAAAIGAVAAQGAELFRMIRKGRLEWRGELTAANLEQVRAGQRVTISAPGGASWQGTVRTVAPSVDAGSWRGLVYVDLRPAPGGAAAPLRTGSYVRGEIDIGTSTTLVVPPAAIVARDGYHVVHVLGDGQRVRQRKVQIGRLVGDQQQILAGLSAGERVVASGGAFLSDGDLVALATASASQPTR
jgi:HlyD family secretion protein